MTAVSEQQAPANRALADEDRRTQLTRLVATHQQGLWRYVRYLGADPGEADDLVQETFLWFARSGSNKPPSDNSGFEERSESETAGYLRTAARNQLLMLRRRQQRRIHTVVIEAAENVWADAESRHGPWDDLQESLAGCLDQLEGRPRQAVDMQYRDGASRNAIAEALGMKPDGVKTLLRRTRQLLRECLERTDNESVHDV